MLTDEGVVGVLLEHAHGVKDSPELFAETSAIVLDHGWPSLLQGCPIDGLHIQEDVASVSMPTVDFWHWYSFV